MRGIFTSSLHPQNHDYCSMGFVAPLLKVSPRQKIVFEQLLIYPPIAHYLQQVTEIFATLIHKWRQTRRSTRGSGSLSACLVALTGTRMHTKRI